MLCGPWRPRRRLAAQLMRCAFSLPAVGEVRALPRPGLNPSPLVLPVAFVVQGPALPALVACRSIRFTCSPPIPLLAGQGA